MMKRVKLSLKQCVICQIPAERREKVRELKLLIITASIIAVIFFSNIGPAISGFLPKSKIAWLDAYSPEISRSRNFEKLYIDGNWLNAQLSKPTKSNTIADIQQAILQGKPCAVFGGSTCLSDIFSDIFIKEKTTEPVLAQAVKVYPNSKVGNRFVSDQLFVSGLNMTAEDVRRAVDDWTSKRISGLSVNDSHGAVETEDPIIQPVPSGPSEDSPTWSLVGTSSSYNFMDPHGLLIIELFWYQLVNDQSNTYDWFNLVTEIASFPGRGLYPGSDWRTADFWNYVNASYFGDPNLLVAHGPSGDSGGSGNVTYSIGVSNGVDGARCSSSMSETYSALGVPIADQSAGQGAQWWHNVDENGPSGMNPYGVQPGATIRVVPNAPTRVHNWVKVQYRHSGTGWSQEFTIDTTIDYSRNVDVYVVKASDSPSSWVENLSDVESGVVSAVDDANTRTLVKLDEQINMHEINSVSELYALALNPPIHAVIVDTHGEVIPMPNQYFGPSVYLYSPSDQSTSTAPPVVYASVQPPPACSLDYSPICEWYRPSTGDSGWQWMNQIFNGDYNCWMSLPEYGTYTISVYASANGIWTEAYITFNYVSPGGGGGGCPYVSTWNGSQFVRDNNILPASECSNGTDVTDYYKLQQLLVENDDSTYSLAISEFEQEQSFIDQVELLTVDHAPGVNVGASPYGEILTYTQPSPAVSAIDSSNNNVKTLLQSVDGQCYEGSEGSYVTLNFGDELNISSGAKLVIRSDPYLKSPVYIQAMNHAGDWQTVATIYTRTRWSTDIINMTKYLPDGRGNLKVRLCFTADDKIDFVGLDTSQNALLKVANAQMVSAVRKPYGFDVGGNEFQDPTVCQNILSNDGLYTELTPGYEIRMKFASPQKENQTDIRDFILVTLGHYQKAEDPPRAVQTVWRAWYDVLRENMRNYGWIWTNVAGYSGYYFGNTWYGSQFPGYNLYPYYDSQQAYQYGLGELLGRNVEALINDGGVAVRRADFTHGGFTLTYTAINDATELIYASRPLPSNADLPIDAIGYIENDSTNNPATVALVMNNTVPSDRSYIGAFIHNGVSAIVNATWTSAINDWFKGYMASAMAIEETRELITWPAVKSESLGVTHGAVFAISMRPAGWGEDTNRTSGAQYNYVDLLFQIGAHYDGFDDGDWNSYYLSQADLDLSSGGQTIHYKIETSESGLDNGGTTSTLMNDIYWWSLGAAAGAIPILGAGLVLGPAVGLVPIIHEYFNPTITPVDDAYNHIYANGTFVNPHYTGRGTVGFHVRILFYGDVGPGTFTFTVKMASWIAWTDAYTGRHMDRYKCIPYTQDLTFYVKWYA